MATPHAQLAMRVLHCTACNTAASPTALFFPQLFKPCKTINYLIQRCTATSFASSARPFRGNSASDFLPPETLRYDGDAGQWASPDGCTINVSRSLGLQIGQPASRGSLLSVAKQGISHQRGLPVIHGEGKKGQHPIPATTHRVLHTHSLRFEPVLGRGRPSRLATLRGFASKEQKSGSDKFAAVGKDVAAAGTFKEIKSHPVQQDVTGLMASAAAAVDVPITQRAAATDEAATGASAEPAISDTQSQRHSTKESFTEGDDMMAPAVDLVKWLVIGMIVILFLRFLPYMGVGLVESALKLLGAESVFLQSAGASRLATLAHWSTPAAVAAIQGGAVCSLQRLLQTGSDAGLQRECVRALLKLADVEDGLREMRSLDLLATLSQLSGNEQSGEGIAALERLQHKIRDGQMAMAT